MKKQTIQEALSINRLVKLWLEINLDIRVLECANKLCVRS